MKAVISAILVISLSIFASCEKVIDVNVKGSKPQYVIEGSVTNSAGPHTVRISRSTDFDKDSQSPAVTNARVIVADDMGHTDTLIQTAPGVYQTGYIQGIPGHTYRMEVSVDGQSFIASSGMPEEVIADSAFVVNQKIMGRLQTIPVVQFKDPAGVRNYYHFVVYKNGKRTKQINILHDQLDDGRTIDQYLPEADSSYKVSDKIVVEMQSISQEMYQYYYSLQQTIGQGSASPGNPVRQIKGDNVIGYFSANTAQTKAIVIP